MALSYALRLVCLVAAGIGLMQTVFEILLWLLAPALLRVVYRMPPRQQERVLYAVQILPLMLAAILTGTRWVPDYVTNETNFEPERVGWICLLFATMVVIRWGARISSGIRMALRTVLFTRDVLRTNRPAKGIAGRIPVVAVSDATPRVVLVGLLRPLILISKSLTENGGLDPLALDLVLEHERSHATQRDNWKLFSLQCLPRLPLRVSDGKTWMQLWQNAAERAADSDAVQGDPERALRLAETLVALARSGSTANTQLAWTHFLSAGSELASRVDRLTQGREAAPPRGLPIPMLAATCGLAVLAGAIALIRLAPLLAGIPELLLHLG